MARPRTVTVTWLDAARDSNWRSIDEAISFAKTVDPVVRSHDVWLLDETEDYLLVAHRDETREEHILFTIQIPKVCVIEITGRKKRKK